jgi:FkbM family methyltransferase
MTIIPGMEHCADVLTGVYNLPLEFKDRAPVVLDVGANVGAFVIWARDRWSGCNIISYEPVPENFERFMANLSGAGHNGCGHRLAVRRCSGQMQIRPGKNNCGEWSTRTDLGEQEGEPIVVPCMDAADLPQADILKLDTEGCELEILERLWEVKRNAEFKAILLEWHSESDRMAIDRLLSDNYQMAGAHCHMPERGVAKYVLRSLVKKKS